MEANPSVGARVLPAWQPQGDRGRGPAAFLPYFSPSLLLPLPPARFLLGSGSPTLPSWSHHPNKKSRQ